MYLKSSSLAKFLSNYRVTSQSNHCCQISNLAGERPGILVMICCFLFLTQKSVRANIFYVSICVRRRHSNIFRLPKPVYCYAFMFASLY